MCCGDDIRYRRHAASVFLFAFDLIELNGDDLRCEPFETRKATLAPVLATAAPGLLKRQYKNDGATVLRDYRSCNSSRAALALFCTAASAFIPPAA